MLRLTEHQRTSHVNHYQSLCSTTFFTVSTQPMARPATPQGISLDGHSSNLQREIKPANVGVLRPQSCNTGTKHRTQMAEIYGQSSNSGQIPVYSSGASRHQQLERQSTLLGIRYKCIVESLLHDSSVDSLLRSCSPPVMASAKLNGA